MSGDPYFAFTSLLLPMTADFTDVSASPKTFTAYGNAAISSAQSKWGSSSGFFDGSGDYLETPYSAAFRPDNDSFTIEMWVRPAAIGSVMTLFANRWTNTNTGNYRLCINADGKLEIQTYGFWSGRLITLTSSTALVANQWQHVAISRVGAQNSATVGAMRLFIDGKKVAVDNNTFFIDFGAIGAECSIGRGSATIPDYFSGHLQDVRFTTGIARYISEFTPPAAAFPTYLDLSCTATLEPVPLTCAPAAISGPAVARLLADAAVWDSADGGSMVVAGTVTLNGVPGARKVRLHTLNNGRLVRETWSHPVTGAYRFERLKDQPYYVWSEDHVRTYDPVSHLVENVPG